MVPSSPTVHFSRVQIVKDSRVGLKEGEYDRRHRSRRARFPGSHYTPTRLCRGRGTHRDPGPYALSLVHSVTSLLSVDVWGSVLWGFPA